MAFNVHGNTAYSDTANKSISIRNIRVIGVVLRASHASNPAILELGDDNSGRSYPDILHLAIAASEESRYFDFGKTPIVFPTGVRLKTVTDAEVTLIFDKNSEGRE